MAGNDSKVANGSGTTFLASAASHGLTRCLPTPRTGSRASSLSPRDPSLIQLLQEVTNWCLQPLLRVLGFDPKRAKIRALWLPIYRGFGLISKRIRSRSHFDPSIKLISTLVRFNLKGKTPKVIRVRDELSRAAVLGSVTPSQLGSAGPTGGQLGRTRWNSIGLLHGLRTGERTSARLGR
jgi:hypothetical protein